MFAARVLTSVCLLHRSAPVAAAAQEGAGPEGSIAFISTPSLYFSIPEADRKRHRVLDVRCLLPVCRRSICAIALLTHLPHLLVIPYIPYIPLAASQFDTQWSKDAGFVHYDFRKPTELPAELLGTFDVVVIDPPFITEEVWRQYADTAYALLKGGREALVAAAAAATAAAPAEGAAADAPTAAAAAAAAAAMPAGPKVVATTVFENAALIESLFPGCKPQPFLPSIPHLVYQYQSYASFPSSAEAGLGRKNAEIPDWD